MKALLRGKRDLCLWAHQMGNRARGKPRGAGCDVLAQSHAVAARGGVVDGQMTADGGQPLGAEQGCWRTTALKPGIRLRLRLGEGTLHYAYTVLSTVYFYLPLIHSR